jgi:hypothetical protein
MAVAGLKLLETPTSHSGAVQSYWIVVAFGLGALAVAASHAWRRLFGFFGGLVATLLGLYGLALIILGSEDVGGLRVSLPWGLSAIALAAWTIYLVLGTVLERGDVA